jgi:uncharacterized protein (TIGR00730 family)
MKKNSFDRQKINKIPNELIESFKKFQFDSLGVAIYGSARLKEDNHFYKKASQIASHLHKNGYKIITGGGGGIMEAANKEDDDSIGLRIKLPNEQKANEYVENEFYFSYFSTRKMAFMQYAQAYVIMPGGFGTLDELSELLCQIQTEFLPKYPIVFFGVEFFQPLLEFLKNMVSLGCISKDDLDLFIITDSVGECVEYIIDSHKKMGLE